MSTSAKVPGIEGNPFITRFKTSILEAARTTSDVFVLKVIHL